MITIVAKEGAYLTQVAEVADTERIYATSLSGMSIKAQEWCSVTKEQRDEWIQRVDEQSAYIVGSN